MKTCINKATEYLYCQNKVILIDKEDLKKVKKFNWQIKITQKETSKRRLYYKVSAYIGTFNGKQKHISLHRFILGITNPKIKVDHINRNTLDNRKCNLRIVSNSESTINTRVRKDNKFNFKGISYRNDINKFRVRISLNGKRIQLGNFDKLIDAKKAYLKAAEKFHKNFSIYGGLND